jgi:hypothetical protein
MNMLHPLLALVALAFTSACSTTPEAKPPLSSSADTILQHWSGDYPIAELKRLPKGQQESRVGYLADPTAFGVAWSAFQPGEAVPAVDFGKCLVVFVRNVDFYNRTNIFKTKLEDGILEILTMETRAAIPIKDKAAMAMAVVPRAGVKFVQAGPTRVPVTEK